jgi:hypothetical protein
MTLKILKEENYGRKLRSFQTPQEKETIATTQECMTHAEVSESIYSSM